MKTLKILVLAGVLMGTHGATASGYYTETKLITTNVNGTSVTYQCYVEGSRVLLYNAVAAKYLVRGEMLNYTMKDGGPIPHTEDGYPQSMDDYLFVKEQQKARYIVTTGFPITEKNLVKGYKLIISMAVTSEGKVSEVRFGFRKEFPYQQIPLSTFAKVEQSLKQQLYYHKTTLGKQMIYDIVGWMHDFTQPVTNPSPTPPSGGGGSGRE